MDNLLIFVAASLGDLTILRSLPLNRDGKRIIEAYFFSGGRGFPLWAA